MGDNPRQDSHSSSSELRVGDGQGNKAFPKSLTSPTSTSRPVQAFQPLHGQDEPLDDKHRARILEHVRGLLLKAGSTNEEIDKAIEDDMLDLLAVDRLLIPSTHRYTQSEVSELTGLPIDILKRFWRSLGFLDVGNDERIFTDLDIESITLFQGMMTLGSAEMDSALQLARVIGSAMARIADAEVVPGSLPFGSETDNLLAADAFASVADTVLPVMARLLEFVWRRHVQAATRRSMLQRSRGNMSGNSPILVVGFADMVGFTLLSQHLGEAELAAVVRRFEEISHDIVTSLGGRVVKMIGDEAMFVLDSVTAGVRIGIGLAEAYADDELLSDVRVGLAVGPVLVSDGDYYGPVVNLAHRIVNIANPGTVLMSDDFHTALMSESNEEFFGQELRPRLLKDIGRVQLWQARRAGQVIDSDGVTDRRRSVRWERLGDVIRDLEDLREVGERLLSNSRELKSGEARC